MTRLFQTATLTAALLLTTTLAVQAANTAPRGDQMRPGIDPVTTSGVGEQHIASPGEPFNQPRPKQLFPCWVDLNEDGEPQVHFTNQSGVDYPLGTVIEVTFSNGGVGTYTHDLYPFPDQSKWAQPLPYAWMPPLTCTVDVQIAEAH